MSFTYKEDLDQSWIKVSAEFERKRLLDRTEQAIFENLVNSLSEELLPKIRDEVIKNINSKSIAKTVERTIKERLQGMFKYE